MAGELQLHQYVEQIEELVEEHHFEEAVAHGRYLLQHYPKHLATYRVLGKAMLETGQEGFAEDMFKRVLSGDPEDYVARVGLSIVCDRSGDFEGALWHMERAFELAPDNEVIRGEIRQLYGQRDGVEPGRLELTRAALARVYARGGHYDQAVEELQAILAKDPERFDLKVALAEVLWRSERRARAEQVCLEILEKLPFCLKPNLLLGEIYTQTGRIEGREHLQRAGALDPENLRAVELLGEASPLEEQEVRLPILEYTPPEREVEWAPAEEAAQPMGGGPLADETAALEAQIEIPAWLEEVALGEEGPAPEEAPVPEGERPAHLVEQPASEVEGAPPEPAEELPDWLEESEAEQAAPEGETTAAEAPDWLATTTPEEGEEAAVPTEEAPSWLAEDTTAAETEEEPAPAEGAPAAAEIPDWLTEMAPEGIEEEGELPAPEAEVPARGGEEGPPVAAEIPDWLREMAPEGVEEETLRAVMEEAVAPEEPAPPAAEVPGWLAEEEAPAAEPAAPEAPEPAPAAEEEGAPAWLEGEEVPSGDDAVAWLESLMAGKEDELRAAAEEEAEARVRDITGVEAERAEEPAQPEEPTPPAAEAEETPEAPAVPDWLVEEEAPAAEVPAPEAPEPAPPAEEEEGAPAWLEGEEVPSGDDAVAWLESLMAGKEDELRAAAEEEAEARVRDITGVEAERAEEPAPPEEPTPPAAEAEEAPEAPAVPDWLVEEEVAPAEPAAPEAPEPAPAAEEEGAPAWLEGDEVPSGDDAVAWLESLMAGKEDELRAAAEEEAEARVRDITGVEAERAEEPAPPEEPTPPAAEAEEAPEAPAVPDWLVEEEVAPAEPAAPEPPEPAPAAEEEPFGWTAFDEEVAPEEAVPPTAEPEEVPEAPELPDWLVEEEAPAAEAPTAELPEVPTPAAELEEAPAAEAPAAEAPEPAPAAEEAFGWTAFDEEVPAEAAPAPAAEIEEEEAAPADLEAAAAEVAAAVGPEPEGAAPAEAEPQPAAPAPPDEEEPEVVPEPEALGEDLERLREYASDNPRDYEAHLELARGLWERARYEESLEAYSRAMRSSDLVEEVVADMEARLDERPSDARIRRVLGDAYMRDGQLERALTVYREALETL